MPGQTERQPKGWTEGEKDGQTLFYITLPATAGSPKNCVSSFSYKS